MTNQVGQGGLRTPATCSTSTLHTRCKRTCRAQPRATASQGHVSWFPARCSSSQRIIERAAAGEPPKYAPHSGLASIARPWCWEGQPETPRRFRESPRRGLASVARARRWEGHPGKPRWFRESPRRGLASLARVGVGTGNRRIPRYPHQAP